MNYEFKLPFNNKEEIEKFASEYSLKYDVEIIDLISGAKKKGYLNKEEFMSLCKWKSQRPSKHYESNNETIIIEVTKICFDKNSSDELRIKILQVLNGVSLRVASAILHLVFLNEKKGYPIMDVWVLSALGVPLKVAASSNKYGLWEDYLKFCRKTSEELKVDMRTLDRALWFYGKNIKGK